MTVLRVTGNLSTLRERVTSHEFRSTLGERQRAEARRRRQGISTRFPGNGSAALSVTNTDRTLGASPRQGWRLSGERGKNARHNTAEYVAFQNPEWLVTADDITPAANTAGQVWRRVGDHDETLENVAQPRQGHEKW